MSSPELLPAEEFGHARLSAPSESQSGSDAEPPVMPNATGRSVLIRRGPRLEQRDELAPSEIEHGAPSGTSCASSPLSWKRPQVLGVSIRRATASVYRASQAGRASFERAQDRRDLHVGPFPAARRWHSTLIELPSNGVVTGDARPLDFFDNGQDVGRELPRIRLYRGNAAFCGGG